MTSFTVEIKRVVGLCAQKVANDNVSLAEDLFHSMGKCKAAHMPIAQMATIEYSIASVVWLPCVNRDHRNNNTDYCLHLATVLSHQFFPILSTCRLSCLFFFFFSFSLCVQCACASCSIQFNLNISFNSIWFIAQRENGRAKEKRKRKQPKKNKHLRIDLILLASFTLFFYLISLLF